MKKILLVAVFFCGLFANAGTDVYEFCSRSRRHGFVPETKFFVSKEIFNSKELKDNFLNAEGKEREEAGNYSSAYYFIFGENLRSTDEIIDLAGLHDFVRNSNAVFVASTDKCLEVYTGTITSGLTRANWKDEFSKIFDGNLF